MQVQEITKEQYVKAIDRRLADLIVHPLGPQRFPNRAAAIRAFSSSFLKKLWLRVVAKFSK